MSGLPSAITESFVGERSEKNDEGIIHILRKLQKYVGLSIQVYETSNVIMQEKEVGDAPSPKRVKLNQSNELSTSEDECFEKTDYVKSQKGMC